MVVLAGGAEVDGGASLTTQLGSAVAISRVKAWQPNTCR